MSHKKSDRQLIDEAFAVLVEHFKHGKEECYESAECECEEGEAVNLAGEALSRLDREVDSLREQVRTLTADNAVQTRRMDNSCPACHGSMSHVVGPPNGDGVVRTPCTMPIHHFARERSPGATLLVEMDALRARVAELEAKHTAQVDWAQKCEYQRVEAEAERDRWQTEAEQQTARAVRAEDERDAAQQRSKALEKAGRAFVRAMDSSEQSTDLENARMAMDDALSIGKEEEP